MLVIMAWGGVGGWGLRGAWEVIWFDVDGWNWVQSPKATNPSLANEQIKCSI